MKKAVRFHNDKHEVADSSSSKTARNQQHLFEIAAAPSIMLRKRIFFVKSNSAEKEPHQNEDIRWWCRKKTSYVEVADNSSSETARNQRHLFEIVGALSIP
ncbi:hypothetical protein BV898_12884 [Hypsibius exemplaris]|uniref:Uncharacterized protein n=1 Tax=Hypsibius exemplaris TaxID=2072580 RepID=A0A1W0WCC9_HYPEX|nr:hypothetical protein BV898_12884 [Hypsibius exemplaris]